MKVLNLSLVFLTMAIALGCNQSNSKMQENKAPQEVQRQMPEQTEQNPAQFQQPPSQATEVSDKELGQFAEAAQQVQIINQEVQEEMINVVEENDLEVQRFSEIQQAQMNPQNKIEVTKVEMEKYEASTKDLEKIQEKAQKKMQEKLTEAGLTMPRYEEIALALQSDIELQQKFQMLQQQK